MKTLAFLALIFILLSVAVNGNAAKALEFLAGLATILFLCKATKIF